MSVSRRQLLGGLLAGGAAAGASAFGLAPDTKGAHGRRIAGTAAGASGAIDASALTSRDAHRILADTIRLGRRIQLGTTARADDPASANVVVVQVKVMAMFMARFLFKLGALDATAGDGSVMPYAGPTTPSSGATGRYGIPWGPRDANNQFSGVNDPSAGVLGTFSANTGPLRDMLVASGIDKVSMDPRWAALRFNGWFGSMLSSGKPEAALGASLLGDPTIYPGGAQAFPPASAVAVQAFVSNEMISSNRGHSFVCTCLTEQVQAAGLGGDLAYHLDAQNIVSSPLGIVTFASGLGPTGVGGFSINDSMRPGASGTVVLGNDLSTPVAKGQPVASYVDQIQGLVQGGHVDLDLVQQLDAVSGVGTSLRKVLVDQRSALGAAVGNMQQLPTLEGTAFFADAAAATATATMPAPSQATYGASQGMGSSSENDAVPAKAEFLAQCRFVQEAVKIPGLPFRNFVLALDVNDLNGHACELAAPSFEPTARCLSPLEGMRQLAIGLNMLAQSIQAGANGARIFVIVSSDGGRTGNMVDSTIAPGIVLGPGSGTGALKDFLYADYARMIDPTDPFTVEQGEGPDLGSTNPGPQRATRSGCARPSPNRDGTPAYVTASGGADTDSYPTTGGLRVGLIRHLESVTGVSGTTTTFGSSYKLQTT